MTTNVGFSRRHLTEQRRQSGAGGCSTAKRSDVEACISSRSRTVWRFDGLTWRSTASVDAMLQDLFVLCLRARMCMSYEPGEPGERGLSFLYDFLCLVLMRRLPMQACILFVRSCLRRAAVCMGGCHMGPAWVSGAGTLPWMPRKCSSA